MNYKIGQIVKGHITGIKPYGAFVCLDDNTPGLIHISEISEGFVKNVENFFSINDEVVVKIIDFDRLNNQARLSLKAVRPNNYRKERKAVRFYGFPVMKLGFDSIENKLDEWIRDAKEENDD